MINAIILSAGESKRMGKLKPLLKFNDKTFIEQIISILQLSNVDRITVVLGAEAEKIKNSVDLSGIHIVINKDYKKGQLSSLITAIKNTPEETEAILVCLVDNPFITEELTNKIVEEYKKNKYPIIVPVYQGQNGHPVLFDRSLFDELLNAPEDKGARYVIYKNEEKVFKLETNDRGAIIGINSLEDYYIYFGTKPE
jgi:CTP:molybdopterin cytidylyltransferase MocA